MVMLGWDVAAALPGLQAEAESRMRDTVEVKRVTGVTTDPLTGVDSPSFSVVYSGKCRVRVPGQASSRAEDSAGSSVTASTQELHVPVLSPRFLPGDVAVMASDTASESLRGVTFRVLESRVGSDVTAQRVPVEFLSGVSA